MKKPIIIMIANQKGGVGKTTCAVELCNAFGKKGYKVLGIDLDPQNSFSKLSRGDISTENTIRTVLTSGGKVLPQDAIQTVGAYDIIVGDEELAFDAFNEVDDVWLLADALEIVPDYDFVIIDSAPGRSKLLDMEYRAADYIIAPTEADTEAESGLFKITKDIEKHTKHGESHVEFLGVFMNKFKKQSNLHQAMYDNLNNISESIGAKRFDTTIRDTVKAGEARFYKKSISEHAKNATISEDFDNLVDEIIDRIKEREK